MSEQNTGVEIADDMTSITSYARGTLIVGILVIVALIVWMRWHGAHSKYSGQVSMAPEISIDDARKAVWFSLPDPKWLPEHLPRAGAHVTGKDWVSLSWQGEADRWLDIGKGTKRPFATTKPYQQSARKSILVNGNWAIYIQGQWAEDGEWSMQTDVGLLEWTSGGFHYRIEQSGMGLDHKALVHIAESMIVKQNAVNTVPTTNK